MFFVCCVSTNSSKETQSNQMARVYWQRFDASANDQFKWQQVRQTGWLAPSPAISFLIRFDGDAKSADDEVCTVFSQKGSSPNLKLHF